jgi:hypothetical protein
MAASRWGKLIDSQAGLGVDFTPDGANLTPKNVLQCVRDVQDFEFECQVFEDCIWTLTVNEKAIECICRHSMQKTDKAETANTYYVDSVVPIRVPIAVGDTVSLALDATWKTKKTGDARAQNIFEGTFTVPEKMQLMGAPGYLLHVKLLETLAYLSVGNVIQKETQNVQLEILSFNITLIDRN